MKLKELIEKYGEQEVLCWAERADESLEWVNIKLEPPKPKSVWELKDGDSYFVLYTDGDMADYEWKRGGGVSNDYRDQGNVFITKEEVLKEKERRAVETLLLKHGGRRWFKKDGDNWFLYLDDYNIISRSCTKAPYQGMIYFDTHGEAVDACEKIGSSRIKKALLEVR